MILTQMNKDEILKEFSKYAPIQWDRVGKKCDRLYNKVKILFRKNKEPVWVGDWEINYNGTIYHVSTMINFPLGTRTKTEYYTMLLNTYTLLVLPSSGKKIALYINPGTDQSSANVISYSTHFLKRFWERWKGQESEGVSIEELAKYYFKERNSTTTFHIFRELHYKDYPGPMVISRHLKGMELGWLDEETGIYRVNTFISEDMFKDSQEEMYGPDSEVLGIVKENMELIKTIAPLPLI